MPNVLAVDPGTSTGYCVVQTHDPTKLYKYGQTDPHALTLWLNVALDSIDEVAIEGIFIGPKTGIAAKDLVNTLDVLGWVTLECQRRGILVTRQKAADARAFSTDEKLKALGWWNLGQARGNRDVRSAARHMLLYLVNHGYLTPRSLV